jgi:hypothetical protein
MASRSADQDLLGAIGLNFAEAAFLCEALAALMQTPAFTVRMWSEMREVSRAKGLDKKWAASSDELFERLGRTTKEETLAVIGAALQFSHRRKEPTARLLRDLGLLTSQGGPAIEPLVMDGVGQARRSGLTGQT